MGRRKKRRRVDNQPKYIQACADKSVFQGEEIKDKHLMIIICLHTLFSLLY